MAGLGQIRDSPQDGGRVVLVVSRPSVGLREPTAEAVLDQVAGLVGDNWLTRGSKSMPDGSADPERQVTVMNARAAELVAGGRERMPLAGDQLYVDLDLSLDNLPAGTLLAVGQAVLRVSKAPHLGCAKFVERFGAEAMRFVNSRLGRQLRLRGMNTCVVVPGIVRPGDLATKAPISPAVSSPPTNGDTERLLAGRWLTARMMVPGSRTGPHLRRVSPDRRAWFACEPAGCHRNPLARDPERQASGCSHESASDMLTPENTSLTAASRAVLDDVLALDHVRTPGRGVWPNDSA
jgi:MOSC domain-containing protein YiiM